MLNAKGCILGPQCSVSKKAAGARLDVNLMNFNQESVKKYVILMDIPRLQ